MTVIYCDKCGAEIPNPIPGVVGDAFAFKIVITTNSSAPSQSVLCQICLAGELQSAAANLLA